MTNPLRLLSSLLVLVGLSIGPVQALADSDSLAAGYQFSLFIKSDGSLWGMGSNDKGQLGDGTTDDRNLPIKIVDANVTAVSAGTNHSLFLTEDGSMWGMGFSGQGQLGNGFSDSALNRLRPEIIAEGVVAISAASAQSYFIKEDGSLWAMGSNTPGQLGTGTSGDQVKTPTQVETSGVVEVVGLGGHALYIKDNGSLWGMGSNFFGPLGNGVPMGSSSALPIEIFSSGVKDVGGGSGHSLIVMNDGSLWAIGKDMSGQLGDGRNEPNVDETSTPVLVLGSGVAKVASGGNSSEYSLFFKTDGSLWAMGRNQYGQLGDGTTTDRDLPMEIASSGVTAISTGWDHSLFVRDGSLWGMGNNQFGQLGDGSTWNKTQPDPVHTTPIFITDDSGASALSLLAEETAYEKWYELSWFGFFYYSSSTSGWIYHLDHGWIYPALTADGSIWFYDAEIDHWLWVSSDVYSSGELHFLYSKSDENWLFHSPESKDPRWFYRYSVKQWQHE